MSRNPRGPAPRRGLHPAATAIVVIALAAVAVGVGWIVGAGGPGARPPHPSEMVVPGEGYDASLPAGAADDPAADLADAGGDVFRERCAPCHTIGLGPSGGAVEGGDLARAALRRDPRWVRAMMEEPDSMFQADSTVRRLLEVHGVSADSATSEDPDLRALLAYLRSFDPGR